MSKLLEGNIIRHLTRLTLPSMAGMVAIMVFNLTDTWFVSRLGTEELAAMGFTFAVIMAVASLSVGFSTGATSIITRAIGAGNLPLARRTVSDGLVLTIAGTVVIGAVGYFSIEPLFGLLGAEGRVLELVKSYMQVWFLCSVVAILPPVSDGCLRSNGDMVRPLVVMCLSATINLILDPIFIFGLGPVPAMGIKGAAIATVIGRSCALTASLCFLHFRHRLIDWQMPQFGALLKSWKEIIRLGIPAAITQALNPFAQGFYVRIAAGVGGTQAVAAMATGTRIEIFLFILAISYSIAIGPFVGHNYGAKDMSRVQEARRLSNRFAMLYGLGTFLLLLPTAKFISSWFSDDPKVVYMSTTYLLIAALGHTGVHVSMWMNQLLNVIGRPKPVMMMNLCRVFVLIMPLTWLGSRLYGFTGLVIGLTLANLLAGTQAYYTARYQLQHSD